MKQFQHIVTDPLGLHGRPSKELASLVKNLDARVSVTHNNRTVNSRSILQLMSLGAVTGDVVTVSVDGENEDEAFSCVKSFFQTHL